jgi:hypothetical protein
MNHLFFSIRKTIGDILGEVSIEGLMNPDLVQAIKDLQQELIKAGGSND